MEGSSTFLINCNYSQTNFFSSLNSLIECYKYMRRNVKDIDPDDA